MMFMAGPRLCGPEDESAISKPHSSCQSRSTACYATRERCSARWRRDVWPLRRMHFDKKSWNDTCSHHFRCVDVVTVIKGNDYEKKLFGSGVGRVSGGDRSVLRGYVERSGRCEFGPEP